jgi:hypothetical protein
MNQTVIISANPSIRNATHFHNPADLECFLKDNYCQTLIFVIWHWKVPDWILTKYNCIGCHTGPLLEGKGKGGSPIRNLRALNVQYATLCAFTMTPNFDEGKVHVAIPISLEGTLEDVYRRIDIHIPRIVAYLTQPEIDIPEKFKRLS